MSTLTGGFRTVYGSHPLHLLVLIAGFALFGAVIATLGVSALWNPTTWWQSIAVWFAAAVIVHDLVLFPVYALADRVLAADLLATCIMAVLIVSGVAAAARDRLDAVMVIALVSFFSTVALAKYLLGGRPLD